MSAESILAEFVARTGWSVTSQLALALEYIGNQDADGAFAEFLAEKKDAETYAKGSAGGNRERVRLITDSCSTVALNRSQVPVHGPVYVHDEGIDWADTERPEPIRLMSPTWGEIIEAMETQQTAVGDFHHVFLEAVIWGEKSDGWHVRPSLGS